MTCSPATEREAPAPVLCVSLKLASAVVAAVLLVGPRTQQTQAERRRAQGSQQEQDTILCPGGPGTLGLVVTQHSPPSWLVPDASGAMFCLFFSLYVTLFQKQGIRAADKMHSTQCH